MADAVAQGDRNRKEPSLVPPSLKKTVKDKNNNETYIVGKFIGKGGFARCYEAKSEEKGTVCCKVVWEGMLRGKTKKDRMKSEVDIHRKMKHPNIVRFEGSFEDDDYFYIMMELCRRGSLKELIDRRKSLTEPEVRYYALQLLGMLEYLKREHVVHRDLKLANVFISDDMTLRLGDFGLAAQLSDDMDRRRTQCGTPNYTAPEVLNNTGHSYEVDMWAFGIILYTLLVGIPPFHANGNFNEICNKIRTVDLSFPHGTRISDEAKDIIELILQANPDDRPSIKQVRQHPFFKEYTPHTLSRIALHSVPQFTADTKAKGALRSVPQFTVDSKVSLKRSLDSDVFSRPSRISGPSTPHKKARTLARDALHSVLQPSADTKASLKRSFDSDIFARPSLIPDPSTPHKKARFTQSPLIKSPVLLPSVLNKMRQAKLGNHIPTSNKPRGTVYGNIVHHYHAVKNLIALGHSTSDIENLIGNADQSIPNFISKWQTEGKLGYNYQFIDGTKGIMYPNLTTISTSPDFDYVEYIKCSEDGVDSIGHFDKAGFQQAYPEKDSLFQARIAKLDNISPAIQPTLRDALLPSALTKPKPIDLSAAVPTCAQLSYATKINHTKNEALFRLSDGSVQMILNCGQFISTDKGRSILFINNKGTSICKYKLVDILYQEAQDVKSGGAIDSGRQKLYNWLNCFMEITTHLYNCSQQKNPALPGKSSVL